MPLSRRNFIRLAAGTGALAAMGQLGRSAAVAGSTDYRAMVGVFLFGGNDGFNMVVPSDARHAAYSQARGVLALPASSLTMLPGSSYGLHPAMSALRPVWDQGALSVVLNAGTLFAPLTKAQYLQREDLRPLNLMSHADEQTHWQTLNARGISSDGFMGRIADRMSSTAVPSTISFAGNQSAVLSKLTMPMVLPSSGDLSRAGTPSPAEAAAIATFSSGAGYGELTEATARTMDAAYANSAICNAILTGASSLETHFVNPQTGAPLTSDVARQLMRVARMIDARGALGHQRQTFLVSQGSYDTHAGQAWGAGDGPHAWLLADLAMALAGFYNAMKAIGLAQQVTAFTMSDFGRTYKPNAQNGSDHAWGNNHLVVGGGVNPAGIHGRYPEPVLGGPDDIDSFGRFVPTLSQEEYLGAIARWYGVADADMPYVFPNWATWSSGGRGPLQLFRPQTV